MAWIDANIPLNLMGVTLMKLQDFFYSSTLGIFNSMLYVFVCNCFAAVMLPPYHGSEPHTGSDCRSKAHIDRKGKIQITLKKKVW